VCVPCILHAVTLFELVESLFNDDDYVELKGNIYKLSIASMLQNLAYLKVLPNTKRVKEDNDTRIKMYDSIVNRFVTAMGKKYGLEVTDEFKKIADYDNVMKHVCWQKTLSI